MKFLAFLLMLLMATPMALAEQAIIAHTGLRDAIEITYEQVPITSGKLKRKYQGHRYTITNNSDGDVNLLNAQIINGVNGSIAVNAVDTGSGVGPLWAIAGPVGLFTFGIGWIVGLVGTPVVLIADTVRNNAAEREAIPFDSVTPIGTLAKNNNVQVMTLSNIGAKPQLKVTVQSIKSNEILVVAR